MKKELVYVLLSIQALLSGCTSDLQVIGKYRETMVVYGLLDQAQPKQYIKINKAFLGEGNAYTYALIKDSTHFTNALDVKLKRLSDGTEYHLSPDNSVLKDPGIFYSPDQSNVIFTFNSTGSSTLNATSDYELVVKNNETGNEARSKTSLISDFGNFTSPSPASFNFSFIVANNPNYRVFIKWNSGKNARIYQTIVRLNYIDSTTTGNVTQHIDWVFPEQKTQFLSGGEAISTDFRGQDFLKFVGNRLNDFTGLIARRVVTVDIISVAAGDELNTYIEVNKPSTGIIQQKPEYTNIVNGLGVFSSRYYKAPFSKPLSTQTMDSLACGQYTKQLKFKNSQGVFSNCP